jgi:hypothetical protein
VWDMAACMDGMSYQATANIKTIKTAVYPNVRAFKNTVGLVSKVDSRVAAAVVWCALFASTAAVSSAKLAKGY